MSKITQVLEDFNLEEIDDYFLTSEMQDYSSNDNHTRVSSDGNYYNSEYNYVLRNDENIYEPSSVSSDTTSTVVSLHSDTTSTVVLHIANASSAVSLPTKQRLHGMIKEKMRAEGRQETPLIVQDSLDYQPTLKEEKKKLEKKLRNKQSARKSRQKQKEYEEKLKMNNKTLTATNEKRKQKVARIKNGIEKCKQFLSNHQCTIYPQQENGDKMCMETGGTKVCRDDDDDDDDDDVIVSYIDHLNICGINTPLPISQGSKSQHITAIESFLKDDDPSEIVTSGAAYAAERFCNVNAVFPGHLLNELKTGTGGFAGTLLAGSKEVGSQAETFNIESTSTDQLMSQEMSAITDMATWTNNSSVPSMKKSKPKLSPWSTEEVNQSEADEARNLVRGFSPPPEKKLRRE